MEQAHAPSLTRRSVLAAGAAAGLSGVGGAKAADYRTVSDEGLKLIMPIPTAVGVQIVHDTSDLRQLS